MRSRRVPGPIVAAVLTLSGCGSADDEPRSTGLTGFDTPEPGTIGAQVANFELVAGHPQRFRVGLVAPDNRVIAFGTIRLRFAYLGTKDAPIDDPDESISADASFLPVAGQAAPQSAAGPRLLPPSEGLGVYGAELTFDRPGYWAVRAEPVVGGEQLSADANFEVRAEASNPFPGELAPRTVNPLPGEPNTAPRSIDSRATDDGSIPDPELHSTTIDAAIDARRPLMVVVSTPTYCVSRFCGPITEEIEELAQRYGSEMSFVHLEVWEDYDAQKLNPEALEWIGGDELDIAEPWVFLVGPDGVVVDRWDNVVTDAELRQAVATMVG
jgi:hypothetical protein